MTIDEALKIMEKKKKEDNRLATNGLYKSWRREARKGLEFDELVIGLLKAEKLKENWQK